MKKLQFFMLLVFICSCVHAKFDIGKMMEGMGQSFGAPPSGYVYSIEIWNHASVTMYTGRQAMSSFMGAFIPQHKDSNRDGLIDTGDKNSVYDYKKIPSIFDVTGSVGKALYKDARYYYHFYVSANSDVMKDTVYFQPITNLPLKKQDPNIYFYNIFMKKNYKRGKISREPEVEMLGFYNPDTKDDNKKGNIVINKQLNTIYFHNSSSKDVLISLMYGKKLLELTIEKFSYAQLTVPTSQVKPEEADNPNKSEPLFSLRPNTFVLYEIKNDQEKKYDKFLSFNLPADDVAGYPCNIEIYEKDSGDMALCLQGFTPGNFDQPVTKRVRDVTPCPCFFWHQSVEQIDGLEGFVNLPGQIWIVYNGKDSVIAEKVLPGELVEFDLIRPLLAQSDTYFYCLYVMTQNDAKAKDFVQRFIDGTIGEDVKNKYQSLVNQKKVTSFDAQTQTFLDVSQKSFKIDQETLNLSDQLAILQGPVQGDYFFISDTTLDVVGYCLGADVFTPKGVGFGRFYYSLAPSIMNTSGLVPFLMSLLDQNSLSSIGQNDQDLQNKLGQKIDEWIKKYSEDKVLVEQDITSFIKKHGKSILFDNTQNISNFGAARIQNFITGDVSIQLPPMKLSVMTNYYVYDFGKSKPKNMPEQGRFIVPQLRLTKTQK